MQDVLTQLLMLQTLTFMQKMGDFFGRTWVLYWVSLDKKRILSPIEFCRFEHSEFEWTMNAWATRNPNIHALATIFSTALCFGRKNFCEMCVQRAYDAFNSSTATFGVRTESMLRFVSV